MPEISRFLGIKIFIRYNEHNPPHFHAEYGNEVASFFYKNLALIDGNLPPRVLSLVIEWASIHRMNCWRIGILLRRCPP